MKLEDLQLGRWQSLWLLLVTLALGSTTPGYAQIALGTSFSYQGQLTEAGQPANGLYDLQVCLFDSPGNPIPLACAPDFADVPVERGVFAIALDFGAVPFSGQQRFLELRVRPGASTGGYTILAPRQLVRATPEAMRASAAPWSGLTGVPAGFADGIDNDSGGTVTSVTAGTGLSGGTITGSGTIGIAPGGVGSVQIADGGVAAVDIAPGAVGSGQLALGAVGSSQLAPGAVGSSQLAPGAVGLAQINPMQVQARISGSCEEGEYLRGINADGTLACERLPGLNQVTTVDVGNVGRFTSIAIGADGFPVISYYDQSAGDLKVAKCGNAACTGAATITAVDATSIVGLFTSIAIGNDGAPVISYSQPGSNLKVARCSNAACTGTATITILDSFNSFPAEDIYTSIAVGTDGRPVISYGSSRDGLKVAKCGNASCSIGNTTTIVDGGTFPSIAISTDGLPVISYFTGSTGDLKVVKCGNAACSSGNTITTVDVGGGTFSSIAIGTDGLPVISYHQISTGDLKVAKCINTACTDKATITTVDVGNVVGIFTSIAIGADGFPVISYYDDTADDLKVAKCGNAACTGTAAITTVDAIDNVGADTSIAIGTDGLPVISYHGSTAGALRVAKCGTRSCR